MKSFILITALCLFGFGISAAEKSIDLPLETDTYRPGPNVELAKAQCSICHSVEYTSSQPAMGEEFWNAIVLKMKNVFGAPISDEAIAPLTEYLVTAYGKKG